MAIQQNLAFSTDWRRYDQIMVQYLEDHEDLEDRWLFHQTILTAASRRSLLGILRPQPGWRTLDLGCGYGPVPLEMAGMLPLHAFGVDMDPEKIDSSVDLGRRLRAADWFPSGSSADFAIGDVYDLDFPARTFDFMSARFLFQHLTDPRAAISEMGRVIEPGGTVCIVDIDDGLSVTYPELPGIYTSVVEAMFEVQGRNGGDRQVGRKIASYLDEDGFTVTGVLVMAEASFGSPVGDIAGRTYLEDRIRAVRNRIVEEELLSEKEIESSLTAISAASLPNHFILGGHLAVLATRDR
jgi:ubiquinone/menaquinone biosynthesis C-methylase UbiE